MPTLSDLSKHAQDLKATASDGFNLRIHRTLSWLKKAESAKQADDLDMYFLALWVAFNAAYARELDSSDRIADKSAFRGFLQLVCRLDKDGTLYEQVWQRFSGSIRILLDNQYTFQPFWDFHNGLISETTWQDAATNAKKKTGHALAAKDTDTVLAVVFERLYTLRNQIFHGGATYASSANRAQLKDGCAILASLVPHIVAVMLAHHADTDWGKPFYPFVPKQ